MGLLRIILALSVVAGHSRSSIFGFNGVGATVAVPIFFVISGFYMAMILNEKYISTPSSKFYASRAMRIYPIYFIGVMLALTINHSEIYSIFKGLTTIPKIYMIISNLTIFGGDLTNQFCWLMQNGQCERPINLSLNAPAWSLSPELLFYLAAPAFIRSRKLTVLVWFIGCSYYYLIDGLVYPIEKFGSLAYGNMTFIYSFFPSSVLYFATGALGYHYVKIRNKFSYLLALVMLVALCNVPLFIPPWMFVCLGVGIPSLFLLTKDIKIDRVIGELSYPVYILHFPLVNLYDKLSINSAYLSKGSIVATSVIFISIAVYYLIDKKISKFRHEAIKESVAEEKTARSMPLRVYLIIYLTVPLAWVCVLKYV